MEGFETSVVIVTLPYSAMHIAPSSRSLLTCTESTVIHTAYSELLASETCKNGCYSVAVPPQAVFRVFVSYFHNDSTVQHGWQMRILVRLLAESLLAQGVLCDIDQFHETGDPPALWPRWMANKVRWADVVLLVATSDFLQRSMQKGSGVESKLDMLLQALNDSTVTIGKKRVDCCSLQNNQI